MQQLSTISNLANTFNKSRYLIAAKQTLSSYYNLCLVLSVLIYILVNATFQLTRNALHIAKTLPFSEKEIWLSQKIFKMISGLFIFEIVLIVLIPSIKLITHNVFYCFILLVNFHLIFLSLFLILDLIYDFILVNVLSNTKLVATFMDILFVALVSVYAFTARFKVDYLVGLIKFNVGKLIRFSFFILLCILIMLNTITLILQPQEIISKKNKFWKLPLIDFKNIIEISLPAIIRTPNFAYIFLFTIVIFLFSSIYNSANDTLNNMMFVFPLIGVSGISYSDATLKFRKHFKLYNISEKYELLSILFTGVVILIPALVISLIKLRNLDVFAFGFSIYLSSIILGFLLPKSYGSVNETISSIIILIVIVLLSLTLVKAELLYIIICFLIFILFMILKKGM